MEMRKIIKVCERYDMEYVQIIGVENGSNGMASIMFFDGKTLEEKLNNAFNIMRVFRIKLPDRILEIGKYK